MANAACGAFQPAPRRVESRPIARSLFFQFASAKGNRFCLYDVLFMANLTLFIGLGSFLKAKLLKSRTQRYSWLTATRRTSLCT